MINLSEIKNENFKLEVFKNEEFGEIRTVMIENEPWFVGKDVATVLGYSNQSKALNDHVDSEDKLNNESLLSLGQRGGWIINESGLYSLVLSSKLESAKKFKRWITSEVLPTIRKTGGYINNSDLMVNTYFSDISDDQKGLVKGLLCNIEEKQKKIISLTHENDLFVQKNLEWADRPLINALVRSYATSIGNNFGKAWNDFKKEILYRYSINLNSRITHYLNTNGKRTKPKTLDMLDDSEIPNALSAIVAMCKENEVDIEKILNNKAQ